MPAIQYDQYDRFILTDTIGIAQKEYVCAECHQPIYTGNEMNKSVRLDQGRFCVFRYHPLGECPDPLPLPVAASNPTSC